MALTSYLSDTHERLKVCVLEGCEAVLEHAGLLEQLAERCGDFGAMHWLGYFLTGKGARWKRPCVVLFLRPIAELQALQADDLCAAALFYEITALGLRTGAFSTDDWEGGRTITAPPAMRSQVIAMSIEALIQQGAQVVLATYQPTPFDKTHAGPMLERPDLLWAEHSREINKRRMALGTTYEGTLTKFGKQTRFNLQYYRRRLLAKMNCEFITDVCAVLSEEECVAMNTDSLNPVPVTECKRRYHASRDLPGGFLVGLRRPGGHWLSVLGGWRQGFTTVMYYQINSAGYEKDSLGTVMRGFFLENEVERGTRTLVFYHGTNHAMSHAFDVENVCDLIARRRSMRAWILRRLAALLVSSRYYSEAPYFRGSTTFFAAALTSDQMEWRSPREEV